MDSPRENEALWDYVARVNYRTLEEWQQAMKKAEDEGHGGWTWAKAESDVRVRDAVNNWHEFRGTYKK